ncbi:MAG: D-alanine--D-alanine ligase [Polyangiaceae bacterium]|nr:D-alanine--D-alanine ligase [Polyangiaceae bacterium]
MRVGLTYDLESDYLAQGFSAEAAAEFDRPDTIDALEAAVRALGHTTDRIGHVRALAARLVAGDRWDLVFNIAEGVHGIGREAQVPCLLDAWGIPYTFSEPLVLALTLHKGMTKRVVRSAGVPTPDFAEVEDVDELGAVSLPLPIFAKPIAEGSGKGIGATSLVRRQEDLAPTVADLLLRFRQPVLLETFLSGREFTVGILGTGRAAEAVGVMEVKLLPTATGGGYGFTNKKDYQNRVTYAFPRPADDPMAAEAAAVALGAWKALGCRDAGRIDVRADAAGRVEFIECNPLAGLHPTISDLPILCAEHGLDFPALVARIVASAARRHGL